MHTLSDEVLDHGIMKPAAKLFVFAAAGAKKQKPVGRVRTGSFVNMLSYSIFVNN